MTDQYDAVGQVTLSYDTQSNISLTTYDPARRPYLYQDTTGNISTTMYDPTGAVMRYLAGLDQSVTYHYDPYGRFHASESALGEITTTAYDGFGRVGAQITPDSVPTALVYDDYSRWTAQEDLFGYRFTTNFDEYGRQTGYTDELGYSTTLILDLLDRPIAQMDPLGYRTSYAFDAVGRIAGRQDATGARTTSVYDLRGNQVATVDAYGQATTYIYDSYSRRIAVENPLGYVSTTVYDAYGRVSATQNPRGYATTTIYDSLSRPWATEDALGYRTTTVYDNLGRFQATEDPLGNRSTTVYDQLNRVIGQVDPLGCRTSTVYDSLGRVWASIDPLGNRSTTVYDSVGRVLAQEDALGFRTTSVYDGRGSTIATIDARGNATTFAYDARRQQVSAMDALGYVSTTVYDGLGRQVAQTDPFGYISTTVYDSVGRVAAVQDALGCLTSSVYDLLGRTVAVQDALGRLTTSVYDAASRAVAQVNALGFATTSLYDPAGNRVGWMNALGFVTTSSYDALDRPSGWTDPLGRRHTVSFDGAGRIVTQMDALGQVTTHAWDGRGLETLRTLADGQAFSWSYDGTGRTIASQDGTGITTSAYDALGRLSQVLGPDYPMLGGSAVSMIYAYDGIGNRTVFSTTWGQFTYSYDRRNQLEAMSDPGYPSGIAGVTSWSYDALGRPTLQQNSDGSSSTMAYDPVGRTLQVRHAAAGGSEIDRAFYAFDAVGRPLYKDAAFARHTYLYDALDQLTEEHVSYIGDDGGVTPALRITTWSYDAAQRRVGQNAIGGGGGMVTTYALDAADQMLSAQAPDGSLTTFGYDANGSRTWAQAPSGALTTYAWDAAVRLSAVTAPDGTAAHTFTYDSAGLRHGHTAPDGSGSGGGGVDALLWDAASGAPLAYIGLSGEAAPLDQLFVQHPNGSGLVKAMGTTRQNLGQAIDRQYHTDAQGTVAALTDATPGSGATLGTGIGTLTFDAWGNRLAGTTAAPAVDLADIATLPATAAAADPSFTVTGLTDGVPHSFAVYAVTAGLVSATGSNIVTATPAAYAGTSGNDAAFVSQVVPSTMVAGDSYFVSVTMQNTGTEPWIPAWTTAAEAAEAESNPWRLGSQDPQDNLTWVTGRVELPGPQATVPPGQSATFRFVVTAPATAGSYNFQWRVLQEGIGWFGDFTPVVSVTVIDDPGFASSAAAFVSQSVPATAIAGQRFTAQVTLSNSGSTVWTGAIPAAWRLGSAGPQDNIVWSTGRIELPYAVAPGASVTVPIAVTAPSTPGSYTFEWRIVEDVVGWFGDTTAAVSVSVVALASATAPDAPASLAAATPSSGQVALSWNAVEGATAYVVREVLTPGGGGGGGGGSHPNIGYAPGVWGSDTPVGGAQAVYDAFADFTVCSAAASAHDSAWQYGYRSVSADQFRPYPLVTLTYASVTGLSGYTRATTLGTSSGLVASSTGSSSVSFGTVTVPAGQVALCSGVSGSSGEWGVLRFVAPVAGVYSVVGAFTGLDSAGAQSAVSLQQIGAASGLVTTLASGTLNTGSVGNGVSFDLSGVAAVTLLAGDVLDFVVAFRHSTDSTGVSATVTLLTLLAGGGQPLLMNAGFETPVVGDGSFEYNPSGGASQGWSFDTAFGGGSGVSGNDSSFTGIPGSGGGNPSAPEGVQVAFLQVESTISQAITLYAAGTLQVSFLAAQRANNGTNTQAFTVSIGGTVVGPVAGGTTAFTPVGIDYLRFTTAPVLLPAGTHALTFTGLNPLGGDNTVFLDAVSLVFVPSSDDPFGYLGGLGYWQGDAAQTGGLTYVRQRWLDTASGSWLSVDPVATEPRYGYAHNMPTMRVDPSGTQTGDVPRGDMKYLGAITQTAALRPEASDQSQDGLLIDILENIRSEFGVGVMLAPIAQLTDIAGNALQARIDQQVRRSRLLGTLGVELVKLVTQALLSILPQKFRDLAPRSADELGIWANGFVHGISKGLYSLLPNALVDSVIDLFEAMIREHIDVAAILSAAYDKFVKWSLSFNAAALTPRQRGELVGSALIGEVVLIFTAVGAVEAAVETYEIGADLLESTGFFRAARGVGQRIGSAGRTFREYARAKVLGRKRGSRPAAPKKTVDVFNSPEAEMAGGLPASVVETVSSHGHIPGFDETEVKFRRQLEQQQHQGLPPISIEQESREWLVKLESDSAAASAHFLKRHSPDIPDLKLEQRATLGMMIEDGSIKRNSVTGALILDDASKFSSFEIEAMAIHTARAYRADNPGSIGIDDIYVKFIPDAGKGYLRASNVLITTKFARVRFDPGNKMIFTAYPFLRPVRPGSLVLPARSLPDDVALW